jgi:ParB family chromosome partitioning protein
LATLPALVREADDRDTLLISLVENVAREQLSPVEEARAYALLLDEFGLSLGDVAERVGKAKPTISNRVRLLELPEDVLWMLARGELTERHARAVLAVPEREGQLRLAKRIVEQGLSARAAERAAQDAGAKRKPRRKTSVDPALAARVRDALKRTTGFTARVAPGRVEIEFRDEHELEELAEALEQLG